MNMSTKNKQELDQEFNEFLVEQRARILRILLTSRRRYLRRIETLGIDTSHVETRGCKTHSDAHDRKVEYAGLDY